MEWLTRLWQLTRDVALTGLGLYVIYKQVADTTPNLALIGAGLTLLFPAGHNAVRQISGTGSSSPPSPPASSVPPSVSSGDTDDR